jgi:hypothetical protein
VNGADAKFTRIAGQAASFATQFNLALASGLDGPARFRVELMTPPGPSTGGGKQPLQHIRLVPVDRPDGAVIVIGSVNTKEFAVEIRTFAMLVDQFASRFKGAPLPIDPERYAALVKQMQTFLTSLGFTVTMVTVSASIQPPPMGSAISRWPMAIAAVLFGLAVLGAVVYALLRAAR